MNKKIGYHISEIEKGVVGEYSKIIEEINELIDAENQNARIMILVELSDLVGSILLYINKNELDLDLKMPFLKEKDNINSKTLLKTALMLKDQINKKDIENNIKLLIAHINSYIHNNFSDFNFMDLYIMSNITSRAFTNGYR